MALRAILDSLDGLDEAVSALYSPGTKDQGSDGKFVLSVDGADGWSLENTMTLKSTLQKERERANKAETSLKPFDGLDPVKYRDWETKVEEMKNWDPDKKLDVHKKDYETQMTAKFEGQMTQLTDKLTGEKDVLSNDLKAMKDQLEDALIGQAAATAIGKHGGSIDLLRPHVRSKTRMKKNEDGTYSVEVPGEDGLARLSPKSGSQAPMDIDELVEELKGNRIYAGAFSGSGASGGGATGTDGRPGTNVGEHQISEADSKDPAKYRAAKAAAEKAGKRLVMVTS